MYCNSTTPLLSVIELVNVRGSRSSSGPDGGLREQPVSTADHDGQHSEIQFVEKSAAERAAHQPRASRKEDVPAGLLLQRRKTLIYVLAPARRCPASRFP